MPMMLTAEQKAWFQNMRSEWFRNMKPFSQFQAGSLFPPLPVLPAELLKTCKVLPERTDILRALPKGGRVCEVGTQEGYFAENILEICQPDELHVLDIDLKPFRSRIDSSSPIKALEGDSSALLVTFPDDYFDWIYIDGDHSYLGVFRDAEVARRKIKPGGLLIFNDFTLWSPLECSDYGVPYVVCELAIAANWVFEYLALQRWMYCDVAIRRPLTNDHPQIHPVFDRA